MGTAQERLCPPYEVALAVVFDGSAALCIISLGMVGAITADTLQLYLLGLPAMAAGLWLGFKLYGKLDDIAFRKVILVLLLISGLGLIPPRGF